MINSNTVVGAQSFLSILLRVMMFRIVAIVEKPTTNHIAAEENDCNSVSITSALMRTMIVRKARMNAEKTLTVLIDGGSFPGYFPPIVASPQSIPEARPS